MKRRNSCGDGRPRLSIARSARRQRGYILLSLLFMMSLLLIAAGIVASSLAFTIRRDREEEMIHRGVEYTRAIRRFTKKVGHYPLKVEDLENTDGLRFLRKRYKDPITGKDFKLLHMTDLQAVGVGGLGSAASLNPGSNPSNGLGNNLGNNPNGLAGGLGSNNFGSNSGFGQNSGQNTFGQNSFGQSSNGQTPPAPAQSTDQSSTATPGQENSTSTDNSSSTGNASSGFSSPGSPGSNNSPQPLSGGVIVGVASVSKDETIREFNHKKHYNDWLFFYDPAFDQGYEIKGPTQTNVPTFANPGLQQGGLQPGGLQGTQGFGTQGFGTPAGTSGFGPQPSAPQSSNPPSSN